MDQGSGWLAAGLRVVSESAGGSGASEAIGRGLGWPAIAAAGSAAPPPNRVVGTLLGLEPQQGAHHTANAPVARAASGRPSGVAGLIIGGLARVRFCHVSLR